jgi:UDP-3-O-[3-hydroxymyristoyl] N-acetylglucosamine deacetylase
VGVQQKTVRNPIHCRGIGLHGGRDTALVLRPAPAGHGIVFRRTDVSGRDPLVPARWDRVTDTRLNTTIANADGVSVSTIEHLMAALAGCEIDNALIDIDGAEVPIMDGSAQPFVMLIQCAGSVEQVAHRRAVRVLKPIVVEDGERRIRLLPAADFTVHFEIEFDSPAITERALGVRLVNGTFNESISRARTFGFLEDIDQLRAMGLARGGSLENAVVVDGDHILNEDGLRFEDEFVRHKILDCVGDLYLAGGPILARVEALRSGHQFNNLALRALFADRDAWDTVDVTAAMVAGWHDAEPLSKTA